MRITERQQILTLLAVTLVIGGVLAAVGANALPALFRGGDLEVGHYDAVFYENGTLVERYTYDVRAAGEYRMLFRYWDAPLVFSAIDRPHIEFVGMIAPPPGTIGYVKDDRGGEVRIAAGISTSSDISTIRGGLAFDNEVGLYNPATSPRAPIRWSTATRSGRRSSTTRNGRT